MAVSDLGAACLYAALDHSTAGAMNMDKEPGGWDANDFAWDSKRLRVSGVTVDEPANKGAEPATTTACKALPACTGAKTEACLLPAACCLLLCQQLGSRSLLACGRSCGRAGGPGQQRAARARRRAAAKQPWCAR